MAYCSTCGNEVRVVSTTKKGKKRYFCDSCGKLVKAVEQAPASEGQTVTSGQPPTNQPVSSEDRTASEQPTGEEEEVTETEEEPKTAEVPTSRTKEVADDFGVWRRLYIPYDVGFAFNRVKADGLTEANDLQSWLVECVDLALEYAYRRRIVFEQVVSKDGKMKFLKEQNLSRDELLGLLKVGSISREEFETLVGGE